MAKSKVKPEPRRNPGAESLLGVGNSDSSNSESRSLVEPAAGLEPVNRQPWLFGIALVLFVSWLVYLSCIAYVVMSK